MQPPSYMASKVLNNWFKYLEGLQDFGFIYTLLSTRVCELLRQHFETMKEPQDQEWHLLKEVPILSVEFKLDTGWIFIWYYLFLLKIEAHYHL